MAEELDLATLKVLLEKVRRRPEDLAFRLAAARNVSLLAELDPVAVGDDKLLAQAVSYARLLKRALDRANQSAQPTVDAITAVTTWIDVLEAMFRKIASRSRL